MQLTWTHLTSWGGWSEWGTWISQASHCTKELRSQTLCTQVGQVISATLWLCPPPLRLIELAERQRQNTNLHRTWCYKIKSNLISKFRVFFCYPCKQTRNALVHIIWRKFFSLIRLKLLWPRKSLQLNLLSDIPINEIQTTAESMVINTISSGQEDSIHQTERWR